MRAVRVDGSGIEIMLPGNFLRKNVTTEKSNICPTNRREMYERQINFTYLVYGKCLHDYREENIKSMPEINSI